MLLYISFAGILTSLISSYYNWKHNRVSIYLTLLIFIISIHGISHSVLIEKADTRLIALLFNNLSPFFFLPGPFLFFYVRGTLKDEIRLKPWDILHFIPFFILLVNVFPYWLTSFEDKIKVVEILLVDPQKVSTLNINWFVPASISLISRSFILLVYTIASALYFQKYLRSQKKNTVNKQNKTIIKWLISLLFFVFLIGASYLGVVIMLYKNAISLKNTSNAFYSIYSYSCAWAMLGLQVTLLAFPQILYGAPILRKNETIQKLGEDDGREMNSQEKEILQILTASNPEIIDEPFTDLSVLLIEHLQENKSYLNPDFSIDDLARELDVPRHHLYYCLNRVLKTKFTDLRKTYRIQHAQKLLDEGINETMSIEGIGFQSGFSSRSNFFNAFKYETGLTPSEYLARKGQSNHA